MSRLPFRDTESDRRTAPLAESSLVAVAGAPRRPDPVWGVLTHHQR